MGTAGADAHSKQSILAVGSTANFKTKVTKTKPYCAEQTTETEEQAYTGATIDISQFYSLGRVVLSDAGCV